MTIDPIPQNATCRSARVLLIPGADRRGGISGMLAEMASLDGWTVVCIGLRQTGEELVGAIHGAGGRARFFRGDAGNEAFVRSAVEATLSAYGRIDGLAITAARATPRDTLGAIDEQSAKNAFWNNFGPSLLSVKLVAPIMAGHEGGAIVFVGTANSDRAEYGQPLYAVTKASLKSLMKQLVKKFARYGVRINMVTPSTVPNDGESWRIRDREYGAILRKVLAERCPRGQLTTPAEVAGTILFLLDERSRGVIGNEIRMDGGEAAVGGDLKSDDWQGEAVDRAMGRSRAII